MVWVEVYCLVEMVLKGLILGLRPANGRRRYKVTPSLIGWAQTSNQPYSNIFAVSGRLNKTGTISLTIFW